MIARVLSSLALGLLVCTSGLRLQAQSPSLDEVLARATAQVGQSMPVLSRLVVEEAYTQRAQQGMTTYTRRLKSDVLLVGYPGSTADWLVFRDVLEVNGKPLGHDPQRLMKLFVAPPPDAVTQISAIVDESIRYHFPGGTSAITNPFVAIALLQPHYRDRLVFKRGGTDSAVGRGVRMVSFEEAAPSGNPPGDPLFGKGRAQGILWIEESNGRVHKTQTSPAGEGTGQPVSTTTFKFDDRLNLMLPVEMRTTWRSTAQTIGSRGNVVGVATYGHFRRFEVESTTTIASPGPRP